MDTKIIPGVLLKAALVVLKTRQISCTIQFKINISTQSLLEVRIRILLIKSKKYPARLKIVFLKFNVCTYCFR